MGFKRAITELLEHIAEIRSDDFKEDTGRRSQSIEYRQPPWIVNFLVKLTIALPNSHSTASASKIIHFAGKYPDNYPPNADGFLDSKKSDPGPVNLCTRPSPDAKVKTSPLVTTRSTVPRAFHATGWLLSATYYSFG